MLRAISCEFYDFYISVLFAMSDATKISSTLPWQIPRDFTMPSSIAFFISLFMVLLRKMPMQYDIDRNLILYFDKST